MSVLHVFANAVPLCRTEPDSFWRKQFAAGMAEDLFEIGDAEGITCHGCLAILAEPLLPKESMLPGRDPRDTR